ncbi:MAG: DUF4271 domain-containing protein [Bacteroidales bacterium]
MIPMPKSHIQFPYNDTTPAYRPADTLKSLAETLGYRPIVDTPHKDSNSITYQGSFFKAHHLKVTHGMDAIPRDSTTNPAYLLVLASLIILVLLKVQKGPAFFNYFKSSSPADRRDKYIFNNPTDWLLSLNALIVYSGIIFLWVGKNLIANYPNMTAIRLIFLLLMPGLLAYLQVKKNLMSFLGRVFKHVPFTQFLISEENKNLRISGLLLIPLLVVAGISRGDIAEIALLISMILILAFYLRKVFTWTLFALKNINLLGIYFFLYLCTVEFLPLAATAKLLISNW